MGLTQHSLDKPLIEKSVETFVEVNFRRKLEAKSEIDNQGLISQEGESWSDQGLAKIFEAQIVRNTLIS